MTPRAPAGGDRGIAPVHAAHAPPTVQVRASTAVAAGNAVLVVECDAYGVWHLSAAADCDDRSPSSARPAHRFPAVSARAGATALTADPTLHQLDGLLPGWRANRAYPGAAWTRSPA